MGVLTERLEIRLSSHTMETLRQEAQRRSVSMAQLVREAIDMLLVNDQQAKMRAANALFSLEAPVADWAEMKGEITAVHLEDLTVE